MDERLFRPRGRGRSPAPAVRAAVEVVRGATRPLRKVRMHPPGERHEGVRKTRSIPKPAPVILARIVAVEQDGDDLHAAAERRLEVAHDGSLPRFAAVVEEDNVDLLLAHDSPCGARIGVAKPERAHALQDGIRDSFVRPRRRMQTRVVAPPENASLRPRDFTGVAEGRQAAAAVQARQEAPRPLGGRQVHGAVHLRPFAVVRPDVEDVQHRPSSCASRINER